MTDPVEEAPEQWEALTWTNDIATEEFWIYNSTLLALLAEALVPSARVLNESMAAKAALIDAIRQQERSRYEELARDDWFQLRKVIRMRRYDDSTERLEEELIAALADPAPSPSTEGVCAECGGSGVLTEEHEYVDTGYGPADEHGEPTPIPVQRIEVEAVGPCPSCTKTGETK